MDPQADQLQIDCGTGDAMEVLLDEEEIAPLREAWAQAAAAREREQLREEAAARLRDAATRDPVLKDLLTVLGLEE